MIKFESYFIDTKYELGDESLVHRWRLGLGDAFQEINYSFDRLGVTPIGWNSTSLFDLVEEAEIHLASVTGKTSEVPPKKPKKKNQETDKNQETETQDDVDTSNRAMDAGAEKDVEKKKLEKL